MRTPSFRTARRLIAAMVVAVVSVGTVGAATAEAATPGAITGHMFDDANRNGVRDVGEAPFADRTVYVLDLASGYLAAGAATSADGSYQIGGLEPGEYRVQVASPDWRDLRDDWVPTTTGSLYFQHDSVSVVGGTTVVADFGIRRIVRSTVKGEPITSVTGADGLTIESYNDAISAQELLDELDQGTQRGGEAATTIIRFDLDGSNFTSASVSGTPGNYSNFSASIWTSYLSWLQNPAASLFHEYGHAWARYHDTVVQQDGSYSSYLEARGLTGDDRLGTSHAWTPAEMIAEDYRQLFGSPAATERPQENTEIPIAADVVGLETYLSDAYTQPPTDGSGSGDSGSGSDGTSDPTTEDPSPLDVAGLTVNGTATASVDFAFDLNLDAAVSVQVIDHRGRVIRTPLDAIQQPSGSVTVTWDRRDDRGREVKEGDYTVRVTATNDTEADAATQTFTLTSTDGSGDGTTGGKGNPGKGGGPKK